MVWSRQSWQLSFSFTASTKYLKPDVAEKWTFEYRSLISQPVRLTRAQYSAEKPRFLAVVRLAVDTNCTQYGNDAPSVILVPQQDSEQEQPGKLKVSTWPTKWDLGPNLKLTETTQAPVAAYLLSRAWDVKENHTEASLCSTLYFLPYLHVIEANLNVVASQVCITILFWCVAQPPTNTLRKSQCMEGQANTTRMKPYMQDHIL